MESRSIQTYFEKNIHLFDTSTPAKNAVLLFHAINQLAGLKCNGLLESDPVLEEYADKLPDWWANSEVISLRYEKPNKKHVYFKFIPLPNDIEINAVSEEHNDVLLSTSFSLKDFDAVDWNNLDSSATPIRQRYEHEIISKLLPESKAKPKEFYPVPEPAYPEAPERFTLPRYYPFVGPPGGLAPDNPFSPDVENYVGPHSGLFARRPGTMQPRYDPPGMGGIPDPNIFPTFPPQRPRYPPGSYGPTGPRFPFPRGPFG